MFRYLVGLSMLSAVTASADDVVWKSEVKTSDFDCRQGGADRIVISGVVNLVHPDDADLRKRAKYITIRCPNLKFEPSSKLTSDSSLDIRIEEIVAGAVLIESTRGKNGENAPPTPEIWQHSVAASGATGADGEKGKDGAACEQFGAGPEQGGAAQKGGRGSDGQNGFVGAEGLAGMHGSNIRLIAGAFEKDATIEVNSTGGDGGKGGLGGRGQDGGAGGSGGQGGEAGDDRGCHNSSRGGDGGPGGDGGNGGQGGQGGWGGNGGRGGDIRIGLKVGSEPPRLPKYNVDGGAGGLGGSGGEPGAGGARGRPGQGGLGSKGRNVTLFPREAGANGWQGPDGVDGKAGRISHSGRDGDTGDFGAIKFGFVP